MASRTASPPDSQRVSAIIDDPSFNAEPIPDKISAYYSLVFPNFTYYLQTLTVTIGRRCIPTSTASSSEQTQVDVDLGPLKSVSRLHARIEYEEEEERFVLVVLGRNGAWVDGAWCSKGSKVPLSERSQIQIASRTFHFVLPPPPAPEDSLSPSPYLSPARPRSPSVDITSLSPPSPLPSASPPPGPVSPPPRKAPPITQSLPNSNAIGRPKTTTGKARKQLEAPAPAPKPPPEDMPPKPPFTYAQLCYRAIKSLGGKATLQDIISWMMVNFDWYRFNEKTGWEKSVRHNLSSNRAFRKVERSAGERGKGFYWAVEAECERMFEEQEARAATNAAGDKDSKTNGRKGKAAAPLEPPLKRSVRGEPKGTPLPPPLTSAPLVFKREPAPQLVPGSASGKISKTRPSLPPQTALSQSSGPTNPTSAQPTSSTSSTSTSPQVMSAASLAEPSSVAPLTSPIPLIPASVILPIIVAPVPASHPSASSNAVQGANSGTPHLSTPPIVLHENQLILNPTIFSHLTPAQLRELEALGAQKALEILQGHIVRFLKERIKTEGRARGRGRAKRARGTAPRNADTPTERKERPPPGTGLFTTTPLPPRGVLPPMDALLPTPSPSGASDAHVEAEVGPPSPIVVVDDDESSDGPVPKRRRLDVEDMPVAPVAV
ncbi:hypothetical protein B0F90DRAFT_1807993 [Multifurca ochricompacta]|uniref:Uncharacterized protein n=1 Tax=Multifurca ochricompacta TaxID=376703 RepID=A0AAD4ME98_9AGAM|nr:hypothetical protein B0F90DRAFT_1807993 [Multifurca ochricompacta]